jgi:hypothetical protein
MSNKDFIKPSDIISQKLEEDYQSQDVSSLYDDSLNEYSMPDLGEPFKIPSTSEYLKESQKEAYMIGFARFVEEEFIEWNNKYWLKDEFDDAIEELILEYNDEINSLEDERDLCLDQADDAEIEEDESAFVDLNEEADRIEKEIQGLRGILKEIEGEKI